ncbi:hypothetical protein J5N97_020704 [Dioscorea zingiberensis]|uniref:Late embryogenesis abundant protein LEA-2 subgroup domain-containing protein n=1 Tax=Dioscorea zingiberensis TaxID=325984 RepID=A0A9D5CIJ8_9LILI|nr:hypothetical protein J5N97_020704 [Dioscorea zingiberensis]
MPKKDCGTHGDEKQLRLCRNLFIAVIIFIFIILLIIFIIWLILHPSRPHISLQSSSIYQLNLSTSSTLLTTTLQATISTYNPNDHIGIYYHNLHVYSTYKGQQITFPTALPEEYQGHHEGLVWSPFLYGSNVPLGEFSGRSMEEDETAGLVLFYVKVDGKVRWRVGSWMSSYYHITAYCPAFFSIDKSNQQPLFKFQHATSCSVDV